MNTPSSPYSEPRCGPFSGGDDESGLRSHWDRPAMRRGGRWCCVVERRACVLVWTAKRVSRPPCGQGTSQVGATYVTAVVRNPAEPNRSWQGLFLVDTGATDSLIPRTCLEAIGLKPKGQRVYGLADGREIAMDITTADIEFMGEVVGSTIVIGDEGRRTAARRNRPRISRHRGRPAQPATQTPPQHPPQTPANRLRRIPTAPIGRAPHQPLRPSLSALLTPSLIPSCTFPEPWIDQGHSEQAGTDRSSLGRERPRVSRAVPA